MDQPTLQLSDEQLAELRQQAATMAEDPTAATSTPTAYAFELTHLKMKEYSRLQKTLNTGDADAINAALAPYVKAWPFAGDPANVESWGELTVLEWKEVVRTIGQEFTAIFQSP
jgi:hypothetical protein